MATINAAECFNLSDRGAIAPGRKADFVLFSTLDENLKIEEVFTGGKLVAVNKKYLAKTEHVNPETVIGKMNIKDCSAKRFELKLKSNHVRQMKIIPGSVVTDADEGYVELSEDGVWHRNDDDVVKVSVVERHHGTGNIGTALIKGFVIKGGAVATCVAHDSHNVIVAGDNDYDMEIAVKELIKLGGGMAVVKNGKVIESVQHEIAGLMTDLPGEEVAEKLTSIQNTARKELGIHDDIDPFMTLCFMSLPVIPTYKVTDLGLFDVSSFRFVPIEL